MPSVSDSMAVGGLLLTGGQSRRMGCDKALIQIGGEPLAVRLGRMLASVAGPAVEVGPGHSGLPVVRESEPGAGPLAALADGVAGLSRQAFTGPVLVLSCDLPRLDAATLRRLAGWPGERSVVPLWQARPQPLCARWSAADLAAVGAMVVAGGRSLRGLLARPGVELTAALGGAVADADTPEELDALGVSWQPPG